MPVQDQAVWKSVNVTVDGKAAVFGRGALLPPPATDQEANTRTLLRLGGALRVVEVVYTPDELAARARRPGQGPAEADHAAGVVATAVAPPADADPRGAAPVVLGPKPPAHGTKAAWVEYAAAHGMTAAAAETLSRDALAERFKDD